MSAGRVYEFGSFHLDVEGRLLFRDEERILLTPKALDVLSALVERRGNPVRREDLIRSVWPDAVVEEGSLTSQVSLLRKALGQRENGTTYIETLPKHGYRFAAPVRDIRDPERPEAKRIMLAVLPFGNLGGGRKDDYVSDGLTEEMITHLGRSCPERLGIIARTSSMHYRDSEKSVQKIGRELGVSYLLEASVRRSGRRVRIAAQLIQVADQTHLWAESYERDLGDILDLQSDVARAVAREIELKLSPRASAAPGGAIDSAACAAYLKGRYLWNRRTLSSLRKSVRYFEQAIEREPRYGAAYAGLADSHLTLGDDGHLSPREATAKARSAAEKALSIDDRLAEAHTSLAHACFHEFRWTDARREFERALELNPSYAPAHFYYSNLLVALGRADDAVREARAALTLDPVSLPMATSLSGIFNHAGRYEEAIAQCRETLETDPTFARAHEELGRGYEQEGRLAEAIAAFRKAVAISGRRSASVASLAHGYALAGKRKQALGLKRDLERTARRRYVSPFALALICIGLDDRDGAFAWLNRAYRDRSSALPFLAVNPRLAPLRGDPRFARLLRRLALASPGARRGRRSGDGPMG